MARKQKLFDVRIDPEFERLIDPLTDEEYAQLKENIREYGLQDRIKIWTEPGTDYYVIIDGHNRNRILHELAEEEPEEEWLQDSNYDSGMVFTNRTEAKEYIIKNQIGRRNLTPFQRTELALKLKPIIAQRAKENQKAAGGAVPQKSSKAVDTRKVIAKAAKVSTDTVSKVEKILKNASEEEKEKLRKGESSINRTFKRVSGLEKKEPLTWVNPHVETKSEQHPYDPSAIERRRKEDHERELRLVVGNSIPEQKHYINLHAFLPDNLASIISKVSEMTGEKPIEFITRHVVNGLQSDMEKLSCGVYEYNGDYDKQKIDDLSKEIENVTGLKADEWIMKGERMTEEARKFVLNRVSDEYMPGEIDMKLI